jgi:hypothetical protein
VGLLLELLLLREAAAAVDGYLSRLQAARNDFDADTPMR